MSEPIILTWKGESHTIPPRRIMEAVLAVEDVITLGQLAKAAQANDPPMGRLARAYASVLRLIGVEVEDVDVYRSMFGPGADMTPLATINRLLSLLVPPDALAKGAPEGNGAAPVPAGATLAVTSNSRKKPSRSSSVRAGARQSSSGN